MSHDNVGQVLLLVIHCVIYIVIHFWHFIYIDQPPSPTIGNYIYKHLVLMESWHGQRRNAPDLLLMFSSQEKHQQ